MRGAGGIILSSASQHHRLSYLGILVGTYKKAPPRRRAHVISGGEVIRPGGWSAYQKI
jgi:hypothetical protein